MFLLKFSEKWNKKEYIIYFTLFNLLKNGYNLQSQLSTRNTFICLVKLLFTKIYFIKIMRCRKIKYIQVGIQKKRLGLVFMIYIYHDMCVCVCLHWHIFVVRKYTCENILIVIDNFSNVFAKKIRYSECRSYQILINFK